jgi:hypothetical protein
MYCPNCGANNNKKQNFCRYCGLHLQDIEKRFLNQLVFGTETKRLKSLRQIRQITDYAQLFTFLTLALGMIFLFYDSSFGKMLITASLLAYFLSEIVREIFGYFQRQSSTKNKESENFNVTSKSELEGKETNKLLEEKPFIPVPSVTENSTELLLKKVSVKKSDLNIEKSKKVSNE